MSVQEQTPTRAIVATLLLVVGTYALVWCRGQPPTARTSDATPTEFSAGRAVDTLRRVLGNQAPHPGGSVAHARVRERIVEELRVLGYEPRVQETLARGPGGRIAIVRNVLARTAGPGASVLLMAHYDSVGAGPGASDDGSGVACVLEIARALAVAPPLARSVMFLLTDGEEAGLIGANAFVEQDPWAAEVGVVINLEARGSGGPSMLFETSGENAELIDAFARAAEHPWTTSVADLVYKNMPNDTDLSVFRARGVPGFNFAFIDGLWHYHTPLDDLAHLDPRSVQHHGDQALALARELARVEHLDVQHGNAVFADLANWLIVRWPTGWSPPLAGVSLLLAVMALTRALRRKLTTLKQLGVGALACCVCVLASMLVASLASGSLHLLHGVRDAATAHPWPMRLVVWSSVLVCLLLIGRARLVTTAGPLAIALAANSSASLLAMVIAVWLPAASYLLILPSLVLGPCAWWSCSQTAGDARGRMVGLALPALAVMALLWFPIAIAMELGFHFQLAAAIAGPLAVVGSACLPAVTMLSSRAARRGLSLALTAFALSYLAATLVDAYSTERPGWLNLRFVDDSERPHARWEASTFGANLPEGLRQAGFRRVATPPFPWLTLDPSLYSCDAPKWSAPYPRLETSSSTATSAGREVRCHLSSPRGAPRLHLRLSERVSLASVSWGDRTLKDVQGVDPQLFFAVEAEGLDITLRISGDEPAEVWLLDQDWSMPPDYPAVRAARPAEFVPRSDGDVSILGKRYTL